MIILYMDADKFNDFTNFNQMQKILIVFSLLDYVGNNWAGHTHIHKWFF